MATIFEFKDYKLYLLQWLDSQTRAGHGLRREIAHHLSCQTAYVSQVLKGRAHFSLEQSEKLNHFLGHTRDEGDFFLVLVQYTRAGTVNLRNYFLGQLEERIKKRSLLKERVNPTNELNPADHLIYFSSWGFAAVHALISVPGFGKKKAIAKALNLSTEKVSEILDFLSSKNLIKQVGDDYQVGPTHLHLHKGEAMLAKHHSNWRIKTLDYLDREQERDLHYSSVVTIGREDVPNVKMAIADCIEKINTIVKKSKAEELFALCLDLFQVDRG